MELINKARELVAHSEQCVQSAFQDVDAIAKHNQRKVLEAFWQEKVSAADFQGSTGYGLSDEGRDKLERIYARVFGAEAALVRPQIVSGTHALKLMLFGVLRPGDHLLFATGAPYDTLEAVVGIRPAVGSLAEWGIQHTIVSLGADGSIDVEAVLGALRDNTKVVMFQRSRGYSDRPALSVSALEQAFAAVRKRRPDVCIAVDNCYGEFVERFEPTDVGADLAAGSLIKNPGAGIASTGGYIVGKARWMEGIAAGLTAPGVGAEAGPTHSFLREFYQALFLAPHTVSQAVKSSILASHVLASLGLEVSPAWDEPRSDIIVTAKFGSRARLLAFCRAVQSSAPVDSYVRPEAAPMAGYEDDVVMAAGAFVQGGSLELSADAPMREPYIGYMQGGLTYEHAYIAIEKIAASLMLTN
ncbi:aminotransferase class I/II-fold pyridoxal phosphate-dependent enzyme [Alicyclobacillus pomorum]|uniref:methionine gamma-lyase family protein n=1 Tax=Alicyclobacillus pomorum TaxID=204470 RepID=UPI0003FD095D|nr:methionine gamma-lyase family protein [Alicyclobacillus pomorum]